VEIALGADVEAFGEGFVVEELAAGLALRPEARRDLALGLAMRARLAPAEELQCLPPVDAMRHTAENQDG